MIASSLYGDNSMSLGKPNPPNKTPRDNPSKYEVLNNPFRYISKEIWETLLDKDEKKIYQKNH